MDEPTPQEWAREAWKESQLELLIPVAAGLAVAQFLIAFFALRSYYNLLLWLCLMGVGFAMIRSFMFLYRLSADSRAGLLTELSGKDLRWLFLPPVASALLYGLIAPNYMLGMFFVFASMPHFIFVLYLARRYARLSPLLEGVSVPALPSSVAARFASVRLPALPKLPSFSFETIGMAVLKKEATAALTQSGLRFVVCKIEESFGHRTITRSNVDLLETKYRFVRYLEQTEGKPIFQGRG